MVRKKIEGTCTGPQCTRDLWALGLCMTHYYQQYRGRPLTPINEYGSRVDEKGNPKTCKGPECDRPVIALGLCHTHYRMQRFGLPLRKVRDGVGRPRKDAA